MATKEDKVAQDTSVYNGRRGGGGVAITCHSAMFQKGTDPF